MVVSWVLVLLMAGPLPAGRTSERVAIDGRLDEPAWAQAVAVSDFRQVTPDEGAPGSERTEVRLIYDDRALYFAFRCFDANPPGLVTRLSRRDEDAALHERLERLLDLRVRALGVAGRDGHVAVVDDREPLELPRCACGDDIPVV